ncbi:kinase-like domain-containing protein [Schizophyllum commune]
MTTAVPPVQATSARERLAQRLNAPPRTVSTIWDSERWWIDHQPWLESRGYMLRPRYRPGWEPSWHSEKDKGGREQAEDSVPMSYPFLMDATRTSDGVVVMLKRVDTTRHPTEVEMTTMFSSPPFSSEPRNHCIPVYDVLQDPDDDKYQLMVLPLLRSYASPRFDTIGEAIECFRQIIQGLCFLHENRIAHRDIHRLNIMMDASPLYTIPYHPIEQTKRRDVKGLAAASYTRTQRPVKYYIIDFGLSVRYDTLDPPPVEIPVLGGDKTVPEFKGDDPSKRYGGLSNLYNPFPTDVYCLGNWIREDFLERSNEVLTSKRLGFEFLRPLVESMTQADPSKRPTMDEVAERFESLAATLSSWKLRSRVAKENDNPFYSMYLSTTHWLRRVQLVALRRAAVPSSTQ